jgi:hypothetical protein
MALPFLGTPDSYNIAQQEQSRQRSIEKTTTVESIQNAIGAAVPALSGVVAGVFASSPLIGLGTAYITDQLRQGAKDRSQRRQARRLENRQRKAAADLLVESGQFQNRRDALAAIEEQRIKQELENVEKEKDALVQKFGLQRKEEKEQERKKESKGEPQPVRSEGGEGLALQSTVANIDDNISAIGDLILDRFADQENNEVEQRRLQRQQSIQQRELRLEAERTAERVDEGEPEKIKDDDSGGFMKGALGTVLSNPIIGIGLAIGALTVGLAVFKDDIVEAVVGLPATIRDAVGNLADRLFEKFFGTSGADRESVRADALESDVKTLQNRRQQATGELDEVQKNIERLENEMPTEEELEQARQTVLEFESKPLLERGFTIPEEVREAKKIAARATSPELERQKEIEQQIQERIQRIDKDIAETQAEIQELRGEPETQAETQEPPQGDPQRVPDFRGIETRAGAEERVNLLTEREKGQYEIEQAPDGSFNIYRLDSTPSTGGALTDVSQKQAGEGKGVSVVSAPTTQTSSTSIKNETNNVQSGPLQSISSDIFSLFAGRRYN